MDPSATRTAAVGCERSSRRRWPVNLGCWAADCRRASASFPKTLARLQGEDLAPQDVRTLNIVTIGRDLLDPQLKPPIKGLFIYNHNAVIVHPDQNTMRRDCCGATCLRSSVTS